MTNTAAHNLTVLILAADASIRKLIAAILHQEHNRFLFAESSEQGIELAAIERPDVIITTSPADDDTLPIYHHLQDDPALADIPVVLLTASASKETYAKHFASGCNQIIPIPFKCADILSAVRNAAARSHADHTARIRILYQSGQSDFVSPATLDRLLAERKVLCFNRKDGVAMIGRDPIRQFMRADYQGPERRQAYASANRAG